MLTFLVLALSAVIIAALSVAAGILLYVYIRLSQTQDEDGPEDIHNETEGTV